jgi:putative endonuclease
MLKTDPATWTDPRHRDGAEAEAQAAEILRREGYRVLEQRYRFHRHDIDLVARSGRVVVFAEVKLRRDQRFGTAAEAITGRKRRDLVRAATAWLQRNGRADDVARFDVFTVDGARIVWIQNAFRPGWR